MLSKRGKSVVASDTRAGEEFDGELAELPDDIDLVFGENDPAEAEVVVVSPGLKPRLEVFEELRRKEIPAVSEIDLAFDAAEAPLLALTGTDGKTTTTALLGAMAAYSEFPSAVGGNIGTPLSAVVSDVSAEGVIVAEVSAFQLWTCHHLRPTVAGFTNIAADHLDYFDDWSEYVVAKRRLARNSRKGDWVVYNADDPRIDGWSREIGAKCAKYGFELERESELDVTVSDGAVVARRGGRTVEICAVEDVPLPGRHNLANVMCATAMAVSFGIDREPIRRAIVDFEGRPHRFERLEPVGEVSFVDDSKATNVNASLAGLSSLEGPYVAIVGGVDKGLELDPLVHELAERAAGVVLIGEIADRLEDSIEREGGAVETVRAPSMEEAVRRAWRWAQPEGHTVVLSPACSSFDMFESYRRRGEEFRRAVDELRSTA